MLLILALLLCASAPLLHQGRIGRRLGLAAVALAVALCACLASHLVMVFVYGV